MLSEVLLSWSILPSARLPEIIELFLQPVYSVSSASIEFVSHGLDAESMLGKRFKTRKLHGALWYTCEFMHELLVPTRDIAIESLPCIRVCLFIGAYFILRRANIKLRFK